MDTSNYLTKENLPHVSERFRAAFLDIFIVIALMIATGVIFSSFEVVHVNVKIAAYIIIVYLYEPLTTTLFGGTLGHYIMGVRVKKQSDISKNINIIQAILRFMIKYVLGIISFFTIGSDEYRRGIHDKVGSVVIYANRKYSEIQIPTLDAEKTAEDLKHIE